MIAANEIAAALAERLGAQFSDSLAMHEQHGRGESPSVGVLPPPAVIFAKSTQGVNDALALRARYRAPIIPFSIGSSLAGQLLAMEAIRGDRTMEEIGQQHGVHSIAVGQRKKEMVERAATLFEGKRGPKPAAHGGKKRVQRLMRRMGLAGMAPGSVASRPRRGARGLPLLAAWCAGQAPRSGLWSTDITYIRLARGFVYLVAIIDGRRRAYP